MKLVLATRNEHKVEELAKMLEGLGVKILSFVDLPALPEVVEDGVSGLLCEVGDYRCIAEISKRILGNASAHEAMRKAARERAVNVFPAEEAVSRYEKYYWEVLERAP